MKPAAALTITRNEPVWLRVWCNYYCSAFPQEDVYVIDNSTTDGSVAQVKALYPQINIIGAHTRQAFDHLWLKETVEKWRRQLLREYRVVLFSETDEFLIAEQDKHPSIYTYACSLIDKPQRYARARGWSVVHQIDSEPPLDLSKPLLADRHLMWLLPDYDKTLILKVPVRYQKGFHNIYTGGPRADGTIPIEDDLILLHAWHIDVNLYHERHMGRRAEEAKKRLAEMERRGPRPVRALTPKEAVGFHGSPDLEEVKELFRTRVEPWNRNRLSPLYPDPTPHAIPQAWKSLLRF